ncbi:unnamed protein product [Leuciscus chuanchicus]
MCVFSLLRNGYDSVQAPDLVGIEGRQSTEPTRSGADPQPFRSWWKSGGVLWVYGVWCLLRDLEGSLSAVSTEGHTSIQMATLRGAGSTGQESASLGSPQMAEEICGSLQDRFYLGFYGMPCLISTTCSPRASATIMSKYTAYISHPQHKCL